MSPPASSAPCSILHVPFGSSPVRTPLSRRLLDARQAPYSTIYRMLHRATQTPPPLERGRFRGGANQFSPTPPHREMTYSCESGARRQSRTRRFRISLQSPRLSLRCPSA